jgi:hypothetical protein
VADIGQNGGQEDVKLVLRRMTQCGCSSFVTCYSAHTGLLNVRMYYTYVCDVYSMI